jgi:hypothetical protein
MVLFDVAGGNNLAIVKAKEGFGIGGPHHTPADDANGDALVCRDAACACEGAGGEGSGGSGGLDEIATRDCSGHWSSGK